MPGHRPALRLPGSRHSGTALTDMTDAGVLAEQMLWAATTRRGRNEAFNVVNGDVFRWRWMWPRLAAATSASSRSASRTRPGRSSSRWPAPRPGGAHLAARAGLAGDRPDRVASWWHTDADLGRDIEVVTDMSKSRLAGFTGYRTLASFLDLFERLDRERIVPLPATLGSRQG